MIKLSLVWHNILPLLLAPLLIVVTLIHKSMIKIKDWAVYFSLENISLFILFLIVVFNTI